MQARIQCGFMAQNEDNADQHHRDMHIVLLTKQIESAKRLVELKMKMLERMSVGGLEEQVIMLINILMDKLEKLKADHESIMTEKRTTNLIVGMC